MGMKGHDKDYTTILNLPKENGIKNCYKIILLVKMSENDIRL